MWDDGTLERIYDKTGDYCYHLILTLSNSKMLAPARTMFFR